MTERNFASDNNSGVNSEILTAMSNVNKGHCIAYGDDMYTEQATDVFKQHFGIDIEVFFVFNGTAANTLSIKLFTESYNSVICANTAHINVDECGAPEKFTGCKLVSIDTPNGKLTPELIKPELHGFGFEHHSQPGMISITQSTEMGTVYSPSEIQALADLAHENNMFLHMDGARIANAAVSLDMPFIEFTRNAGVDVLSFGGTKNGIIYGEAVVLFDTSNKSKFKYYRKQGMQLASKMRFISAQFSELLGSSNLWKKNASHANKMAQVFYNKIKDIPEIEITQKVESNGIFAIVPKEIIEPLMETYFFYMWDENNNEVRWMTSFDTTEEDIDLFVSELKSLLAKMNN